MRSDRRFTSLGISVGFHSVSPSRVFEYKWRNTEHSWNNLTKNLAHLYSLIIIEWKCLGRVRRVIFGCLQITSLALILVLSISSPTPGICLSSSSCSSSNWYRLVRSLFPQRKSHVHQSHPHCISPNLLQTFSDALVAQRQD